MTRANPYQDDPAYALKRMPPGGFDDTDRFWGRIVQRDEWAHTVGPIELVDDPRHGPSIRYAATPVDPVRYRQRHPDADLVETDGRTVLEELFALVGDHRDDRAAFVANRGRQVLAFARRHGPLRLCTRHGAPLGHGHDVGEDDPRCILGGLEPLWLWWGVGRWALAVRDLAVALHERPKRDGNDDDWDAIGWSAGRRASDDRLPRERLVSAVNLSLAAAAPQPRLRWAARSSEPEFRPYTSTGSPLYASIVVQLALMVTAVGGLAVCSICRRSYSIPDRGRRPRSDRRAYCSDRCRRAGQAMNSKTYRRRRG